MGSATHYADAAKRLAGRSVLAVGSGIAAGSRLVAKGITALTADASDREAVRCLRFAHLEWRPPSGGAVAAPAPAERLPVLLVGLATGFQVWRLDGTNPAELVSRRDGPTKLVETVPEPRAGGGDDELSGDRPLLAVAPARDDACGGTGSVDSCGDAPQRAHVVLLYSLRAQGYVRTLSFSGEVLGLAASPRLLVVALRGQLQAFDAATMRHSFSCLTYTPPPPPLPPPGDARGRQQQFVAAGLSSSGSSAGGEALPVPAGSTRVATPPLPPPQLAPFALGPRWLAYAADAPPPQASGQAVAQRLPLSRRDSSGGSGGAAAVDPGQPGGGPPGGLSSAAVADAALQAAARGGQQLRAGLSAVGGAGLRFLSGQYQSWRQGRQGRPDAEALEADAAVAGTVAVRDAATRQLLAAFRPHTSPLAALRFSPCGALLATASVAGHSIHLFRIVPAAAATACGDGTGGAGHAVHLYRLYRGVTPAAIADLALAPDASWVAVSSGRGTTHLFHTPAAAPGACTGSAPQQQQQQQQRGEQGQRGQQAAEGGILGRPPKTLAAGRARRPGLLNGGVAGAATSAARNLYAGQRADTAPIAAAFLAGGPGSPRAAAAPASSLLVVTADGLLTRHLLRAPPDPDAAAAPSPRGAAAPSPAPAAAGQEGGGAAVPPPAAVLEEAERWDVGRLGSWPEREEALPGVAAAEAAGAADHAEAPAAADGDAQARQLWVAQAEAGALAEPGASAAPLPLWQDPQFRFFELRLNQLQRRQSGGAGAAAAPDAAPHHEAPAFDSGEGGGPWLESLPAEPLPPQ